MNRWRRVWSRRFGVGAYPMSTAEFVALVGKGYARASKLEFEATNGGPMRPWVEAEELTARTDELLRRIHRHPERAQDVADEYSSGWTRPILITDAPTPVQRQGFAEPDLPTATSPMLLLRADRKRSLVDLSIQDVPGGGHEHRSSPG